MSYIPHILKMMSSEEVLITILGQSYIMKILKIIERSKNKKK